MEILPIEVEAEVGTLISALSSNGWEVSSYRYDSDVFGNWSIELHRDKLRIRLVKDRSQYMMDGSEREEIKAAGLWKAFDDLDEFRQFVRHFAIDSH